MHAKDGVIDDNTESEEIEHVGKILPDCSGSVLACALEVKPISLYWSTTSQVAFEGVRFPFSCVQLPPGSSYEYTSDTEDQDDFHRPKSKRPLLKFSSYALHTKGNEH